MDETKQVKLLETMMEFDRGDPMRIQHFLKVWGFARQIGKMEELDEQRFWRRRLSSMTSVLKFAWKNMGTAQESIRRKRGRHWRRKC